jgi:hypothetical protein
LKVRNVFAVLLTLSLLTAATATAQNSVFGVHGIGFPGRPFSARSRALGGGTASFDARSALNPASIAGLGPLVVTASSGTSLRGYTALDTVANGLSETRFPFALVGTAVRGTPLSIALSYSNYAEQTYDQITFDSVTIRGEKMEVFDRLTSDGAAADIRGAVAWRVLPRLSVGGALHVLSGLVTRVSRRDFSNLSYRTMGETARINLSGFGWSVGLIVSPLRAVSLGASVRSDTELKSTIDSVSVGSVELPLSYSGGLLISLHPSLRWSTTAERQLWSVADAGLEASGGANAFDTWAVGSGIELGGGSGTPLRMGARYSQLPFSPSDEPASEYAFTAGTALRFAGGRGTLETSVERIFRDGAGAEERAWYLMFALTVMP